MAVLVGTCSWPDKTLIGCGRFYPECCSTAAARPRYYASQFPLVEVDSSCCAMVEHTAPENQGSPMANLWLPAARRSEFRC